MGAHSEQPAPEVWEGLFPLHTTLKRDVERDAAVLGTETPLFEPVLEHHIPHCVLDAGVFLAA